MSWRIWLRELPLKTRLAATVAGTAVALLGVSTYLSFRYWSTEATGTAEQQALLAGAAARAAIEPQFMRGDLVQAKRELRDLIDESPIRSARVYARDGLIVISADSTEDGRRLGGVWLPGSQDLPRRGVVRRTPGAQSVRAYLPLNAAQSPILEVEFSIAAVDAAMRRGARLGIGLVIASLFALATILFTIIEREVMQPLTRMAGMLAREAVGTKAQDPMRMEASVAELIEKEHAVERRIEETQRKLDEQAGLAQVGELAAEMAHEFKKPLASIQTAIELLEQEYVLGADAQRLLVAVNGQLDHLSETMRDLFALAKPVSVAVQAVDLRDVVDGALTQLSAHRPLRFAMGTQSAAREGSIVVDRDVAPNLPRVRGDARRLEQAMLNLLLNAAEAMPGGGELHISAVPDGDTIELIVRDSGPGIPRSEIEHVLKPFYSTKPLGTGLGLPLVARVIGSHGGELLIDSEPGEGTTVRIRLPLLVEDPTTEEPPWRVPAFSS